MEVHHHPHVEKKSLKEYILEGLMIFLAVTMGFFAESLREHLADNQKEKDFIVSFKEDLLTDTSQLNWVIPANQFQFEKLDSLYTLVDRLLQGKPVPLNRLYYLNFRYASGLVGFIPNNRTIVQIKSNGAFRLIRRKNCRDSITFYTNFNDVAIAENILGLIKRTDELSNFSQKILDFKQAKTFWFTGGAQVYLNDTLKLKINLDRQLLFEYGNKIRSLMMMVNILLYTEQHQLKSSKNLIALLNKEYNLANE